LLGPTFFSSHRSNLTQFAFAKGESEFFSGFNLKYRADGFAFFVYTILYLATRWEWSDSRLGRFIPGEIAPDTRWIGGWVGPRAGLDAVKRKNLKRKKN
jgi:hypothetical protein